MLNLFFAVPIAILGFSSIMLVKDKEDVTRLTRINLVCVGMIVYAITFYNLL